MSQVSLSRVAWRFVFLGLCAALLGGGCGDLSLIPVSGKVTRSDGTPVTTGNLRYVPDKSKGNDLPTEPIGQIGADGVYHLTTNGRFGAPPGAYKIVVFVAKPSNPNDMYSAPVSLINKKYNAPETTDLATEVTKKPVPGAYDLKLTP